MHTWKVGDEVWARYYSTAIDGYEAGLLGRVVGVGSKGMTVRLVKPDHKGNLIERITHTSWVTHWPTKEAADAYLAEHPFSTGRTLTR